MEESTIEVYRNHNPNKTTRLKAGKGTSIGAPSTEAQQIVRTPITMIKGQKERPVGSFVKKTFLSEESAMRFLRHQRFLKEKGFPTIPTARRIKGENNALLLTDLSEGGRKRVVSINEIAHFDRTKSQEPILNLEEVKQQLQKIAEMADALGIIISADAYFLVIDENNRAKAIIGDLGGGIQITPEEKNEYIGYYNSQEPAEKFYQLVETFFGNLSVSNRSNLNPE